VLTAGTRWNLKVAGLPCTVEAGHRDGWVVTFAETTVSQRTSLAAAIVEAGAGLVSDAEAKAAASAVEARLKAEQVTGR
jgi:hypothetical protein